MGKTALKVSINKYVVAQGLQGTYGDTANPVNRLANIVTRTWVDDNQNFVPDCNLTSPAAQDLRALLDAYRSIDEKALWASLSYFLQRVVPVAADSGVRLALHPDDPPWSILGLPRIIVSGAALERVIDIVDNPANGITFCAGSLAAAAGNDLVEIVRCIGARGRIHFAHCRNIKRLGAHSFEESAHPTDQGDIDMRAVLTALHETGFRGPIRSDHGRMIWGETGQPGYGLYDRALGAMYLRGLWEGISGE